MAPCVMCLHMRAGICTMTCHKAHNVFDVVPGDVVGSVILATSAATVQVCLQTPDMHGLSRRETHSACQQSKHCLDGNQSPLSRPRVLPALWLMPCKLASTELTSTPLLFSRADLRLPLWEMFGQCSIGCSLV